MKFSELEPAAKERAREKLRQWQDEDNWWEHVYENAAQCAKCLGIEIDMRGYRTAKDVRKEELNISFQYNYSQGDGCCFSGWIEIDALQGAGDKVKAHAPEDEELLELVVRAEKIAELFKIEQVRRRMMEEDEIQEKRCIFAGSERYFSTGVSDIPDDLVFIENELNALVSGFADWIFDQLKAEYEHQTSDEVIDELAEQYDFDEEGCI